MESEEDRELRLKEDEKKRQSNEQLAESKRNDEEKQKDVQKEGQKEPTKKSKTGKKRIKKIDTIGENKLKVETRNYISIFGTTAGKNVKAKSSLALDLNQHFINKSMNLRSEVKAPDDFTDFKACDGQSDIIGLNSSDKYSLSFG